MAPKILEVSIQKQIFNLDVASYTRHLGSMKQFEVLSRTW